MGKKDQKKVGWGDWFFFYGTILGVALTVVSALPPVPWRYARVASNQGNRFVTDRRYGLMGASNQFGTNQMWFSLRTKMQRKTEEFGRPNPLTALVGAAGSMVGSGGAALGCMMWQACKEHVASRYLQYGTVATVGIVCMLMLGIGAICGLASLVLLQFEDTGKKKKKKKKDDDSLEPITKTMIASICFFMFPFIAALTFNAILDGALQAFKMQDAYPYAAAYVGFHIACTASFVNYIVMLIAINRKYHCCAKSKKKDKGGDDDDMFGGGGGGGGGEWGGDYGGGYGKGGGGGGWEGGGGGGYGEGYGKGGW